MLKSPFESPLKSPLSPPLSPPLGPRDLGWVSRSLRGYIRACVCLLGVQLSSDKISRVSCLGPVRVAVELSSVKSCC